MSSPAPPASLPGQVFLHARTQPHEKALEVWDEKDGVTLTVSYAQLADAILAGASVLRALGVKRSDRYAFLANNSVGYLALSLGGMCVGGDAGCIRCGAAVC